MITKGNDLEEIDAETLDRFKATVAVDLDRAGQLLDAIGEASVFDIVPALEALDSFLIESAKERLPDRPKLSPSEAIDCTEFVLYQARDANKLRALKKRLEIPEPEPATPRPPGKLLLFPART